MENSKFEEIKEFVSSTPVIEYFKKMKGFFDEEVERQADILGGFAEVFQIEGALEQFEEIIDLMNERYDAIIEGLEELALEGKLDF